MRMPVPAIGIAKRTSSPIRMAKKEVTVSIYPHRWNQYFASRRCIHSPSATRMLNGRISRINKIPRSARVLMVSPFSYSCLVYEKMMRKEIRRTTNLLICKLAYILTCHIGSQFNLTHALNGPKFHQWDIFPTFAWVFRHKIVQFLWFRLVLWSLLHSSTGEMTSVIHTSSYFRLI